MKKYKVEITVVENGYCFTGEWDNIIPGGCVEAETKDEAEELARAYICENGGNAEDYIYKVEEI